jgi:hypothetical protein
MNLASGSAAATFNGGALSISSGTGGGNGGAVTINAGTGTTAAGTVTISSGASSLALTETSTTTLTGASNVGVTSSSGTVTLTAGTGIDFVPANTGYVDLGDAEIKGWGGESLSLTAGSLTGAVTTTTNSGKNVVKVTRTFDGAETVLVSETLTITNAYVTTSSIVIASVTSMCAGLATTPTTGMTPQFIVTTTPAAGSVGIKVFTDGCANTDSYDVAFTVYNFTAQ